MTLVILPAFLESDLNWCDVQIPEGLILWEFDFGLFSPQVTLTDSATFFSYTLAIEQFVKMLYSKFKERTVGVVLYRGSIDVFSHIQVEEEGDPEVLRASIFADYLHRLASFLPEEVRPFCFFEGPCHFSEAKFLQLTSKDRFWHIELSLESSVDFPQGVLLPEDALFNEDRFERLLSSIEGNYRIIPEARLVEMWQGLDKLFVLEEAVSSQGQRKIKGFKAAGGEVIKFGAEGFEPPTHCSQSSCASQTALCSERDPF